MTEHPVVFYYGNRLIREGSSTFNVEDAVSSLQELELAF